MEFTNDAHTKARITIVPGWLRRLFRARTTTGDAEHINDRGYHSWIWSTTKRNVDSRFAGRPILRALELQDVAAPPVASVSRGA